LLTFAFVLRATREHPSPYPLELANRLIRMFSFVGDTVYDPFMGTGTTNLAAAEAARNSVGVEVDTTYFEMAARRLREGSGGLFRRAGVVVVERATTVESKSL